MRWKRPGQSMGRGSCHCADGYYSVLVSIAVRGMHARNKARSRRVSSSIFIATTQTDVSGQPVNNDSSMPQTGKQRKLTTRRRGRGKKQVELNIILDQGHQIFFA